MCTHIRHGGRGSRRTVKFRRWGCPPALGRKRVPVLNAGQSDATPVVAAESYGDIPSSGMIPYRRVQGRRHGRDQRAGAYAARHERVIIAALMSGPSVGWPMIESRRDHLLLCEQPT